MADAHLDAFSKNPDGSWTCIKSITFTTPNGVELKIGLGMTMMRGTLLLGFDLGKWLDEQTGQ